MRTTGALYLLLAAVLLLGLAVVDGLWPALLGALGARPNEAVVWSAWTSSGLAFLGFVLLLFGLVALVRAHTREEAWRPYIAALAPLAAEYGQAVRQVGRRDLSFPARRDGTSLEIEVSPREGLVRVTCDSAPRQPLAWVPRGASTESPVKDWPVVGSGKSWDLRAEIPAMARPILEDAGLQDVMDRFFAREEAIAVLHLRGMGIEVRAALGAPARLERQVRETMDIAFRIRRING